MRTKSICLMAATGLLAFGGVAACGSDNQAGGDTPTKEAKIGVILPDSASSVRWETADRKFLEAGLQGRRVSSRHPERPGRQDQVGRPSPTR